MAGKVVNLRRARKDKARQDKRAETDARTTTAGAPADLARRRKKIEDRRLDGKELDEDG